MKVLIIGGTGHVGSYLTKRLLADDCEVYVATRGNTQQRSESFFHGAKFITCDATNEESLRALKSYKFDCVVDFPGTAKRVWDVLEESVSHIVACGSLWMYGRPLIVPTPERAFERCFFEHNAVRFDEMQEMLKNSSRKKARFTGIMPPNICGAGKIPLDQYGGRSLQRHKELATGKVVYIPDGPECLISPCDAEDIANLFALAVENLEKSAGELFNVGSTYSLCVSEFIKTYGNIYGVEIPIERVSWEKYITEINPNKTSWWHFYAHMAPDITKAKIRLGYQPNYTPEETMYRAVEWMKQMEMI